MNSPMSCTRCGQRFYLIQTGESWARAEVCDCMRPCPFCIDTGFRITRDERGLTSASTCSCTRLKLRLTAYNRAEVPVKYADKNLDNFLPVMGTSQGQTLDMLRDYARRFKPGQKGWLLWGPPGTGKTHLALGVVAELTLNKGLDCRFVDFFQLLQQLKMAYGEGRGEGHLIAPLLNCDFLVIDELGKGRNSEWEVGVLDQLISTRYNNNRTTFFTSNYSPESPASGLATRGGYTAAQVLKRVDQVGSSLRERLDERILSRLYEMCTLQKVDGEDYRKRMR